MSIKQDSLFIFPKFWKTFKSEVTTDWELVDKPGRISKVIEYDKESILIYKGWPEFRKLNEAYDERDIMFTYVSDPRFHVRFFKQDLELAKAKGQLNKKYRSY